MHSFFRSKNIAENWKPYAKVLPSIGHLSYQFGCYTSYEITLVRRWLLIYRWLFVKYFVSICPCFIFCFPIKFGIESMKRRSMEIFFNCKYLLWVKIYQIEEVGPNFTTHTVCPRSRVYLVSIFLHSLFLQQLIHIH